VTQAQRRAEDLCHPDSGSTRPGTKPAIASEPAEARAPASPRRAAARDT